MDVAYYWNELSIFLLLFLGHIKSEASSKEIGEAVMKQQWFPVLILLLFLNESVSGSNTDILSLSTVKTRSLGMGGAFTSIRDDLAALDFNPAGFSIEINRRKPRASLYLNLISPCIVLSKMNQFKNWDEPLFLIVRGISISAGKLKLGLLLGEETTVSENGKKTFFNVDDYAYRRNSTFGFSLFLAPRVSLGFAWDFYMRKQNQETIWKLGYRYGVVVTTQRKITVGLYFCDFPEVSKSDRISLERLADESLNIGISYTPWKFITLALDVRNVSEEERETVREPHYGIEFHPQNHVVFRFGYFHEYGSEAETFSIGLGLANGNSILAEANRFDHASFIVNSAMLWRIGEFGEDRTFILSCMLRL
jgi:hypothetical protein